MIEILDTLPTVCFWLYVGLAAAFLAQGLQPDRGAWRWAVAALFAAGLGAHLTHFFARWVVNGHCPVETPHEVFLGTGLAAMIVALALHLSERAWRSRALGSFVFVLLTACGGILWTKLGMGEDYKIQNLAPAFQSAWRSPHRIAFLLGSAALCLAAVLALAYAIGAVGVRLRGGESVFRHLASPVVDRWTYTVAGLGFPFMTAALCMGVLSADILGGGTWFRDAKESWALISWALFVIYFHLRFVKGWVGLKSQLLVIGGGVMIWITYMMVHVLPASQASLHVYN